VPIRRWVSGEHRAVEVEEEALALVGSEVADGPAEEGNQPDADDGDPVQVTVEVADDRVDL